jgi:hypothetical protein
MTGLEEPLGPHIEFETHEVELDPLAALREVFAKHSGLAVHEPFQDAPTSPLRAMRPDTSELWVLNGGLISGVYILPDTLLPEMLKNQSYEDAHFEFDLSTEEGINGFIQGFYPLLDAVAAKARVIVTGFDRIEDIKPKQRITQLIYLLRTLQEATSNQSQMLVVFHSHLPTFTYLPISGFGPDVCKLGFESLGEHCESPDTTKSLPGRLLSGSPIAPSEKELFSGKARVELVDKVVADLAIGKNVLVRGPRRGGKTSLLNMVKASLEGAHKIETIVNYRGFLERIQVFFNLKGSYADDPTALLVEICGQQYDGKVLVLAFDEMLEGLEAGLLPVKEFVLMLEALKFIRENQLPIRVVGVMTDQAYPEFIKKIEGNADRKDSHLSALTLYEMPPLKEEEMVDFIVKTLESVLPGQDLVSIGNALSRRAYIYSGGHPLRINKFLDSWIGGADSFKEMIEEFETGPLMQWSGEGAYIHLMTKFQKNVVHQLTLTKNSTLFLKNLTAEQEIELSWLNRQGFILVSQQNAGIYKIELRQFNLVPLLYRNMREMVDRLISDRVEAKMRELFPEFYEDDTPLTDEGYTLMISRKNQIDSELEAEIKAQWWPKAMKGMVDFSEFYSLQN